MKYPGQILPQPGMFLAVFALLTAGVVGTGCSAGSGSSPSAKPQITAQDPRVNEPRMAVVQPLPPCPPAGVAPIQPSQPGTGHHKVTLSWNASPASRNAAGNPVGYCLYRSITHNAAKKKPTCNGCEQINRVPITGTSCLDDLVIDGSNYYYVVTAIDRGGTISSPSNEIPVQIPSQNQTSSALPTPPSVPLCREMYHAR